MTDGFDDIRPYHDEEVSDVIHTLLNDPDLLMVIGRYRFPKLTRWFAPLSRRVLHTRLKRHFSHIRGVDQLQSVMRPYLATIIERTVSQLTVEGLDQLDTNKTYLFISNHRDIAMDPALVNMALIEGGFSTSRVGIGDNLLNQPYVSKLMRLNKSFVVKRSVQGRREKLQAFNQLSKYIRDSLLHEKQHVWLAQKEGRAKNGLDKTDTAVLKMLHMSGKKQGWSFQQSLNRLNIIPVSISYEFDPCDRAKAQELAAIEQAGEYTKATDEDLRSIIKGLQGQKGRIKIHFSPPVKLDSDLAEDWSRVIDRRIYKGYELYPINFQACMKLYGELPDQANGNTLLDDEQLQNRLQGLTDVEQRFLLSAYAQPVLMKYEWKPACV